MLDLAFVARLDFLAHLRELAKKRTTKSDECFVPVETATPAGEGERDPACPQSVDDKSS